MSQYQKQKETIWGLTLNVQKFHEAIQKSSAQTLNGNTF